MSINKYNTTIAVTDSQFAIGQLLTSAARRVAKGIAIANVAAAQLPNADHRLRLRRLIESLEPATVAFYRLGSAWTRLDAFGALHPPVVRNPERNRTHLDKSCWTNIEAQGDFKCH